MNDSRLLKVWVLDANIYEEQECCVPPAASSKAILGSFEMDVKAKRNHLVCANTPHCGEVLAQAGSRGGVTMDKRIVGAYAKALYFRFGLMEIIVFRL